MDAEERDAKIGHGSRKGRPKNSVIALQSWE